jgi:23S rRNA (uracil1939-C5)-methyltransferase
VIEPSPARVDPPCPYFGRCGGCDFQQLNYQTQLETKSEIIRDCLRRIGGLEKIPDFQITAAPNAWHYRSRAQWQYDAIRKSLGYFEGGSRRVCDVVECAVLAPELQSEFELLRERMQQGTLPDDARHFRAISGDGEISIADDHGRDILSEPPAVAGGSSAVSVPNDHGSDLLSEPPAFFPLPLGEGQGEGRSIAGGSSAVHDIARTINGEKYQLNAESFFQANNDLAPALIESAIGAEKGKTAIELYCGVGLFTLPLARRFETVVGVEGDAAASDFARLNLAGANLTNAEIVNSDVAVWLENLESAGRDGALDRRRIPNRDSTAQRGIQSGVDAAALQSVDDASLQNVDFLLLDPPRTGAESRVISGILRLKPKRICYVSCDPATLARDLKKLIAGGYEIDHLAAFDMFPQTHHVETVAHLGVSTGSGSDPIKAKLA